MASVTDCPESRRLKYYLMYALGVLEAGGLGLRCLSEAVFFLGPLWVGLFCFCFLLLHWIPCVPSLTVSPFSFVKGLQSELFGRARRGDQKVRSCLDYGVNSRLCWITCILSQNKNINTKAGVLAQWWQDGGQERARL